VILGSNKRDEEGVSANNHFPPPLSLKCKMFDLVMDFSRLKIITKIKFS
jgi:hypothetical protein